MIDLQLFDGLDIVVPGLSPTARARRRHPMMLLALVASGAPRPLSRDRIMAFLWPDSDSSRANNSLRQALHALRRDLGDDLFLPEAAGGIRLDPAKVTVDLWTFRDAIAREAYAEAADARRGPFLNGVHLAQLPELSHWVESERALVEREYVEALDAVARCAERDGRHHDAVGWRRRQAAVDPCSSRAALGVLKALAAAGDTPGALAYAAVHEDFLRTHLEVAPDPTVTDFVASLRRASPPSGIVAQRPPSVREPKPKSVAASVESRRDSPVHSRRRARPILVSAFGIAAMAVVAIGARYSKISVGNPVIVLTSAAGGDVGRDTATELVACTGPACPQGALPQPAFIVPTHAAYTAPEPGSAFIAPVRDGSTVADPGYACCSTAVFEREFTLPRNAASGTISVHVLADNRAVVAINGVEFGRQMDSLQQWNFAGAPTAFTTTFVPDPSGINRLRLTLWDGGGATGLTYRALVRYSTARQPDSTGE